MPVPETNGEEWDRMEPCSALDAVVELVLHGEYNGLYSAKRTRDGMELRAAALGVFQNFVQQNDVPPPPTARVNTVVTSNDDPHGTSYPRTGNGPGQNPDGSGLSITRTRDGFDEKAANMV